MLSTDQQMPPLGYCEEENGGASFKPQGAAFFAPFVVPPCPEQGCSGITPKGNPEELGYFPTERAQRRLLAPMLK